MLDLFNERQILLTLDLDRVNQNWLILLKVYFLISVKKKPNDRYPSCPQHHEVTYVLNITMITIINLSCTLSSPKRTFVLDLFSESNQILVTLESDLFNQNWLLC